MMKSGLTPLLAGYDVHTTIYYSRRLYLTQHHLTTVRRLPCSKISSLNTTSQPPHSLQAIPSPTPSPHATASRRRPAEPARIEHQPTQYVDRTRDLPPPKLSNTLENRRVHETLPRAGGCYGAGGRKGGLSAERIGRSRLGRRPHVTLG